MNTTIISHRMFVAALSGDAGGSGKTPSAARAAVTTNGARHAAPGQLTVEQLAAFAARYWPDFPFGRGWEERRAS